MQFKGAWYAFALAAAVLILFELFFRFRYVQAGDHLWRIDRVTERACLVRIGEAICSPPPATPAARHVSALPASPTPEPNLP
jgi:hypothetical protein